MIALFRKLEIRYPAAVSITVHFYTFLKIVPETPISVREGWGAAGDICKG
jgi:hypothetical protein